MKSTKTKLVGFVVALYLSLTSFSSAFAATPELSDVKSTHWAYSTIVWAASNNVVKGYPDGTFRPNKEVSEAEFLMMFVSAYQKVSPISGQTHWADPVYTVAKGFNWPVAGVNNNAAGKVARDTPITRGEVANIIAGANGINYMGNNAIQYLLNTNLSGGKTGNTVAGYKATDKLTRAEAVAFIKKAKDAGLNELKDRPTLPTSVSEMPKPVTSLPTGISDVKDSITKVVGNYPGYTVKAGDAGVSIYDNEGYASINYKVAQSTGGNNRVISFDATNNDSLKLATEMLKAAGVNVPANFTTTLESAVQSGKTSTTTIDGYTVYISPSATSMDNITISFKKP
ncbi:S-layer homology domain-containing protein [Paenibacillus sp. FSL P4-0338]|uniref:S-layer homology domain-containing protein n=1 Tax=Paenibacillus sp. FSL P4-0338 TaxID=2921635 RepID=UPI0030FB92AC